MRLFALGLALLAFPTVALAAKKPKKEDPPKVDRSEAAPKAPEVGKEPVRDAPPPQHKHVDARSTNRPMHVGTGYDQWGTRGGALLGGASGLRLNAFGGTHWYGDGYGFGGLEAVYFFRLNPSVDFGLGARVAAWPLGIAPGLELRIKMVRAGIFHLAFSFSAWAPVTFLGMFGNVTVGAHAEPGLLASIFFADNIEFMFGALVPATLLIVSFYYPVPQIGFAGRLGLVYTLKTLNMGFVFLHDIAPGFYSLGGYPRSPEGFATARAQARFDVAVNFVLGVQIKL